LIQRQSHRIYSTYISTVHPHFLPPYVVIALHGVSVATACQSVNGRHVELRAAAVVFFAIDPVARSWLRCVQRLEGGHRGGTQAWEED
jgi:hypothetical protein